MFLCGANAGVREDFCKVLHWSACAVDGALYSYYRIKSLFVALPEQRKFAAPYLLPPVGSYTRAGGAAGPCSPSTLNVGNGGFFTTPEQQKTAASLNWLLVSEGNHRSRVSGKSMIGR